MPTCITCTLSYILLLYSAVCEDTAELWLRFSRNLSHFHWLLNFRLMSKDIFLLFCHFFQLQQIQLMYPCCSSWWCLIFVVAFKNFVMEHLSCHFLRPFLHFSTGSALARSPRRPEKNWASFSTVFPLKVQRGRLQQLLLCLQRPPLPIPHWGKLRNLFEEVATSTLTSLYLY